MNKFGIVISIILLTIIFIYSLQVISENNKCSGVRSFTCSQETENVTGN